MRQKLYRVPHPRRRQCHVRPSPGSRFYQRGARRLVYMNPAGQVPVEHRKAEISAFGSLDAALYRMNSSTKRANASGCSQHEVPRALQCHQLKARGEEFLLPLEHLRAPMRRLFVPVVASPPRPRRLLRQRHRVAPIPHWHLINGVSETLTKF
jgi:hypothetical protein